MALVTVFYLCTLVFLTSAFAQDIRCWRSTRCTGPTKASFDGAWTSNIFAPTSRTVRPKSVLNRAGNITGSYYPVRNTLRGNGSILIFDFGVEVGGILTLDYGTNGKATIGMAFTEGKNWIGEWSDSSNGKFKGPDGQLYAVERGFNARGKYTMPDSQLRGGFRYLTVFLKDTAANDTSVAIYNVELEISFQPTWSNLRAYQGYFHSSDDTLNKLWYSGAYTIQTNCIASNTGRWVPMITRGWANNGTVGKGDTVIVDGAKRDRAVWPGDMGVAVPSAFVSTGDLESIKNALQVIYSYQANDGSFPEAGPPLLQRNSDTYHMWTLIGTYNYILYTDDMDFLQRNWEKYSGAVDYVLRKTTNKGLISVTGKRDWARWNQGGENGEANMILYHTLITASKLATWKGDQNASTIAFYANRAKTIKQRINTSLYDKVARAYKDSTSHPDLHPQDANALAILFDVAPSLAQKFNVSRSLLKNWRLYGPEPPELPGNISPFISSLELHAHFSIGETMRALDLLRRTWGWYLTHANGTQSTMIEGYRSDGTFGYRAERGYNKDPSYVSHSHGWSTGPTSALTNFIAGLDVLDRAGIRWSFKPQFGGLDFAEAGFTTKLGLFRAGWSKKKNLGGGYDVTINTPISTVGEISLPALKGSAMLVLINNKTKDVQEDGIGVHFELPGGSYNITVRSADMPESPQTGGSSWWWPWA